MMNAHILNQIPKSGSIEEKRFDVVSDCKWCLFEDNEYCEWVGVFGNGYLGGTGVCIDLNGVAFVLALGQGYIVDVNTRQQMHKTQHDSLKSVICDPENQLFIATDDLHLYVYDCSGLIHTTRRIAVDGIEFYRCKSGEVYGRLWGLNVWHEFMYNLRDMKLKSAWICDFD